MTQDDIICMAREAGLLAGADLTSDRNRLFTAGFERFAYLVAAAEREACANVCEAEAGTVSMFPTRREAQTHNDAVRGCAAAIRARSNT